MWGNGPYGLTPWGGGHRGAGPANLALVSGEAVRENVIRLTFSDPVYFSRWHDPGDASFLSCYTVTADPTAIGLDGEPSRAVAVADAKAVAGEPTQIDVWLDRAMSPFGSKYSVSVRKIVSITGSVLDQTHASIVVDGVRQGRPPITAETLIANRDFANPQTGQMVLGVLDNSKLGTYQYDSSGDYGADAGIVSYKKRVFRRLTTRKGSFRHLPSYGVILPANMKKLARADLVDSIAADAEDQIRQEPETKTVSVSIVPGTNPGLYIYRIRATTTIGDLDLDVPVPLT